MCRLCMYVDIETDHEEYPGQFEFIRREHVYQKLKLKLSAEKEARENWRLRKIHGWIDHKGLLRYPD